jgi:WD40 repeat protein
VHPCVVAALLLLPPMQAAGDPLPPGARVRMGSPRLRHAGAVGPVVFSPDSKTLATGGWDNAIRLWDTATGKQTRLLLGHRSYLVALAFSPDGKRLASGSAHEPERLRLWDLSTGKQLWAFRPPTRHVMAVAFAPDGRTVALANDAGLVMLLDAESGKERFRLQQVRNTVCGLAFSPDGHSLAVCPDYDPVQVWDLKTRKETLRIERRPPEELRSATFSADGKMLRVTGLRDGPGDGAQRRVAEIRIFDASGKLLRTHRYDPTGTAVGTFSVAPDGKVGAVICWNEEVHLWDVASGKRLRRLAIGPVHPFASGKPVFAPDGKVLTFGDPYRDQEVRLWDVRTGKAVAGHEGHRSEITALAVSPDGTRIATGSRDGTARVWNASTGKSLHIFRVRGTVLSLAFSADGRTLATGNRLEARLWQVQTGKPLVTLKPRVRSQTLAALAFTPDGKSLIAGHGNLSGQPQDRPSRFNNLFVWDVATGDGRFLALEQPFDSSEGSPGLVVTPDGRDVLALHLDRTVQSWSLDTRRGKTVLRARWPDGVRLLSSAFSADGTLFAANLGFGPFRVWDLAHGGRLLPVQIPDGYGQALAFSPDGRFLATAGMRLDLDAPAEERTIRLWELTTGKEAFRLPLPPGNTVTCIAFLPDSRSLVAGMADTTALVWDLTPAGAGAKLDDAGLERLWRDLAGDAAASYRAARLLTAAPEQAVPFLAGRLRPEAAPGAARLARLLADLDGKGFAVRQRAERELEVLGGLAAPALREALAKKPSLEVRRRAERILAKLEAPSAPPASVLRQLRAVAALEWAGTASARRHLRALAGGATGAPLSAAAQAALKRLERR